MGIRNILTAVCAGEIGMLLYCLYASPVNPTAEQAAVKPAIVIEYRNESRRVLETGTIVGGICAAAGGLASLLVKEEN